MHSDDDDTGGSDHRARMRAVSEAFRRHPHDIVEEMEKLGFHYVVDGGRAEAELSEERLASPVNARQQSLVEYFNGSIPPDERMLEIWRAERDAPEPNYALWRRYFRSGNKNLKMLIVFGLEREPTDRALLSDLSFMHIFSPMLKELVSQYLAACDVEEDHAKCTALAQDFENHTYASGYAALMALHGRYPAGSFKASCIDKLIMEEAAKDGISL
jgi:hypothetical protein